MAAAGPAASRTGRSGGLAARVAHAFACQRPVPRSPCDTTNESGGGAVPGGAPEAALEPPRCKRGAGKQRQAEEERDGGHAQTMSAEEVPLSVQEGRSPREAQE